MAFAVRKATTFLVKRMHLRPVRKIQFVFDPYLKSSASVRDVATVLHLPNVLETNQGTQFKFDIKADRSEPQMHVEFNDGHQVLFKTMNLTKLEILDYLFEYVDEKDLKKNESPELVTKSAKVKGKGKRR
ncbi:uncharacterized protein LOC101864014 [Aplysia californica]|uniref:Large ribosomal subunit protein mL53 n=1 Tax=Aplysia californica TaxID=6500 RepID=A0ABM0K2B9_APLCA|nr:uncharacterized protein LOC101864014 [Aplysia californica]